MDALTDLQSIRIPPDTAHVSSVRVFVGAVARQMGCSEEVIEDLRLVASEAAAQAIEEGVAAEGIELRAWLEGPRLTIEIEPSGLFSPSIDGERPAQTTERRALIEALFPDAAFEARGDGRSLLRVRVPDDR
ncbi:MAG TPA: ATP-binding protein [Actinomycetota bacterium]|nr:ATP-binding protein [Actinomycetota bacterium]